MMTRKVVGDNSSNRRSLAIALIGGAVGLVIVAGRTELPLGLVHFFPSGFGEIRWFAMAVSCVGAWLLHTVEGSPKPLNPLEQVALAALFTTLSLLVVSVSWSVTSSYASVRGACEVLGILLMTLIVAQSARLPAWRVGIVEWILLSIVAFTLVLMFAGILTVLSGSTGRLSVLGGGPIIFGRLMGMLLISILSPSLAWLSRPFRLSIVAASLLLIILSGSRGSLFAAVAAAAYIAVVVRRDFSALIGRRGLFQLFAALGLFLAVSWSRVLTILQGRVIALVLEGYTAGRDRISARALEVILEHPVRGVGIGGFAETGVQRYPHNIFLDVAVSVGIAASLLLFLVVVLALFHSFSRRCNAYVAGVFILVLVSGQFSGDLWDSRAVFILLPLLVLTSGSDSNPGLHGQPRPPRELVLSNG